jgi:diacylglycerol kinase family enzyme
MLADILPSLLGTSAALGVVPRGTGNVWARELGLPLDAEAAITVQLARPPQLVDVGRANGRPFLIIASAGFDARIVSVVEARTKALGQIAYPLAGMGLAGSVRGMPCRIWLDDEPPRELEVLAVIATNGRLYGGLVPIAPDARVDDGLLHLALFPGSGPMDAAAHTARVLTGMHRTDPHVVARSVRRLRVESLGEELPVQTDGDPRGNTPLDIEVQPRALLALGVAQRGSLKRAQEGGHHAA